jgi:hypothetical protein
MNDTSTNLSHCATCEKRTATVWHNQSAYCSVCEVSHSEMAKKGMNTAGPWDDCPQCQTRHYYERKDNQLVCEKCGLTKEEAKTKDEMRPVLIGYSPQRVTSGSLLELQYRGKHSSLPVLLSISWLPQHGHTSVRFLPEDFSENISTFRIAIEVPLGATSAIVIDQSGGSRKCEIPINFISTPPRKPLLRRFLGLT